MSIFRIVKNKTNKSKEYGSPCRDAGTVLLFVFLLPYVISCLWGHIGEESELFAKRTENEENYIDEQYEVVLTGNWGNRRITMQEYLIRKLKIVMPKEENGVSYEEEAAKAQAVLLRTELWRFLSSQDDMIDNAVVLQDDITLYSEEKEEEEEAFYEKAVCATDGIYLSYEGQPVKAAFFPVSNGMTRNAAQVWQDDSYPYLVGIECNLDISARDYQSQVTIEKEAYCRIIRELFEIEGTEQDLWDKPEFTYDSAGYVIKAEFKEHFCSGEAFRYAFGLNSASFQIQWQDASVVFNVKGVGHGFGMSQYGANEKAALGESYEQILKDYFFQVELVKIE